MIVGAFGVSRETYPFLGDLRNYGRLEQSLIQLQRRLFDPKALHHGANSVDLAAAVSNIMQPTYNPFVLVAQKKRLVRPRQSPVAETCVL